MNKEQLRRQQALEYHAKGRPGKIEVIPTKEAKTQRDLSLAYSPGVAEASAACTVLFGSMATGSGRRLQRAKTASAISASRNLIALATAGASFTWVPQPRYAQLCSAWRV